jgi:hypothetical protein
MLAEQRGVDPYPWIQEGVRHVPEEPTDSGIEEGANEGIPRRRMLKRIGVATAIAWTAPTVASLKTPAFAQVVSPGACPPWNCGDPITECGGTPCGLGPCVCDEDVDGKPFCWDNISCSDPGVKACTSNADCAGIGNGNWRCSTNCCGQTCLPPCGECGSTETQRTLGRSSGQTAAGAARG